MLILGKNEIQSIFTMKDAVESVKKAFEIYTKGQAHIPLRTRIEMAKHEGVGLFMPGYVPDLNLGGVKVVGVFPKNVDLGKPAVPATMVLTDARTGEVCALLDGTYLTELRTGAASGAATDLLANPKAKIGAIVGTGGQAQSQIEALLAVRKLETLYVSGRNFEKTKAFVENVKKEFEKPGLEILAKASVEDAVAEADVITLVTTSETPVLKGEWLKPGVHINGVGSYRPDMREFDEGVIQRAHLIFVDSKSAALSEAGDFVIPIQAGMKADFISGELGELMVHPERGRKQETDISLFKSVGLAVQDIVTAGAIYEKALANGLGRFIEI